MPTDIKFYQEFGGEKVVFEKEEVTEMKKFAEPGVPGLERSLPQNTPYRHYMPIVLSTYW